MRDLDKYLADRLNEESAFSGREANWRMLTYRLEAAAARHALARWQVAASVLLLSFLMASGSAYWFYRESEARAAQWAEAAALMETTLSKTAAPLAVVVPQKMRSAPPDRSFARPERDLLLPLPVLLPSKATPLPVVLMAEPTVDDAPTAEASAAKVLPFLHPRDWQPLQYLPPPIPHPTFAPRHRGSRLWIGLQGTVGTPEPRPGISLLQGAGVGVEYRAFGQLWLTASADWLAYDVQHSDYLPAAFYRENPPKAFKIILGKPPAPYPLYNVVANQRLRLWSTGLRYRIPVHFWLRPSVHVAHTWADVSPAVYNYTFVDTLPGTPPKTVSFSSAQSTSAYSVRGLWRFGLALERETDEWAFRLGISRQAAFRSDFYDTWLVQGGIWYKW